MEIPGRVNEELMWLNLVSSQSHLGPFPLVEGWAIRPFLDEADNDNRNANAGDRAN
jgi:hypothetical protein